MRSTIGYGASATVWKARNIETGQLVAIKRICKEKIKQLNLMPTLRTEIKIMFSINHPNILKLFEVLESQHHFYLVEEFCRDGDLEKYIAGLGSRYLSEKEATFFLMQLANGFQTLRKNKILHRDLKLANILLDRARLVIGDFGFAKLGELADTKLGTPVTMAPEILNKDSSQKYDAKADLWSLGIVLYQLLFKAHPFPASDIDELIKRIHLGAGQNLLFPRDISDNMRNLLRGMLQESPLKRLNWSEFFTHAVFGCQIVEPTSPKLKTQTVLAKIGQCVDLQSMTHGDFITQRQRSLVGAPEGGEMCVEVAAEGP